MIKRVIAANRGSDLKLYIQFSPVLCQSEEADQFAGFLLVIRDPGCIHASETHDSLRTEIDITPPGIRQHYNIHIKNAKFT